MFDGLLGKKFTNKCKHSIKCIFTRIEPIRRKKQAMLRYLRKDVAELVANGLDINAFGRIEALLAETNHASCYDMIEQYCKYIVIQLPTLQKERECPLEAIGAVSTLIYAAARFSDLPELCDLRRLFTGRYGSCVESPVNAEFIEKLEKKSFPVDKELRFMQEIAQEFSVTWDRKAFEQKISNPPAPVAQDRTKKGTPINEPSSHMSNGRKEADIDMRHEEIPSKGRFEATPKNIILQKQDRPKKGTPICNGNSEPSHTSNGRKEADTIMRHEDTPSGGRFEATPRNIVQKQVQPEPRDIHIVSNLSTGLSHGHVEKARKGLASKTDNVEPLERNVAVPPYVKKGSQKVNQKDDQLKEGIGHNRSPWNEEPGLNGLAREVAADRAVNMVPPYTKPKGCKTGTHAEEHHENLCAYDRSQKAAEEPMDPRGLERQVVRPVNSKNDKAFNMIPPYVKPKVNSLPAHDSSNGGECKDHTQDEVLGNEKPKPVSVRRWHTKPLDVSEIDGVKDETKLQSQTPSTRRRGGWQSSAADDYDHNEGEIIRDRDPNVLVRNEFYGGVGDKHVNRTPSGRRRHGARQINAIYGDRDDDGDEKIDSLLMHYSKKGMENTSGKTRTRTRAARTGLVNAGDGGEIHGDGKIHPGATKSIHPQRAASFPQEPISPLEVVKEPARAISMQPEMLSPSEGRVHPRLPDYEKLAAQFMAMKKT